MIKAICINDKNKPVQIPTTHWIKQDSVYHITHIYKMVKFNNEIGVTIKEIDLLTLKDCPYEQFKMSRFAINIEDLDKFVKLLNDCGELNNVDIDKLMLEVDVMNLEPNLK